MTSTLDAARGPGTTLTTAGASAAVAGCGGRRANR